MSDERAIDWRCARPTIVAAAATIAAEAAVVVACARTGRWWLVAVAHPLVMLALGLWWRSEARRTSRHATLLVVAASAFGPIGAAGLVLTLALEACHARQATTLDDWHAMLFPPSQKEERLDLWRRIGQRASDQGGHSPITPFLDVLAFGSVAQRQSVIAIIVQQFRPAFAPALKAALRDEHNVIRVQAATAIARLENECLERTIRLEAALSADPDDAEALLALATHYDDQAFSGLVDVAREQEYRTKAAAGYARFLAQHPDDLAVVYRLARIQHRRGLAADAERLFEFLLERGYAAARHWLMESLYTQGRFSELRAIAARYPLTGHEPIAVDVAEASSLWAGEEAA
ncbi:MAG: hypothetical protein AB7N65_20740 [Vicinamibacterales bacterium]